MPFWSLEPASSAAVHRIQRHRSGLVSAAFSPLSISGLKYWYRSDQGVTLNAGNVSNWSNLGYAGVAGDCSQANAALQPALTAAAINGFPALTFSNHVLNWPCDLQGACTYFFLCKLDVVPGAGVFYTVAVPRGSVGPVFGDIIATGNAGYRQWQVEFDVPAGDAGTLAGPGYNPGLDLNWHYLAWTFNGGARNVPANYGATYDSAGQALVNGGVIGAPAAGVLTGFIGRNGTIQPLVGKLAEFGAYDSVIGASSLDQLNAYLKARYGL